MYLHNKQVLYNHAYINNYVCPCSYKILTLIDLKIWLGKFKGSNKCMLFLYVWNKKAVRTILLATLDENTADWVYSSYVGKTLL